MQRATARFVYRGKRRRISKTLQRIAPRIACVVGDAGALRSFLSAGNQYTRGAVASRQNPACRRSPGIRLIFLTTCREVFSWRKHAAPNQLSPAAPANLVGPVHPGVLADTQELPSFVIGRESQVVHAPQSRARRVSQPIERRLAR